MGYLTVTLNVLAILLPVFSQYRLKSMPDEMSLINARADALVESDFGLLQDLIALREKHHLSQEDVAVRMGVTQPTVSKFERTDANPRLSTIRRYAMAVDGLVLHKVIDDCIDETNFDAIITTQFSSKWTTSVALPEWGGKTILLMDSIPNA